MGGPRLGTYYLEAGVGERGASVVYDRAGSSFAVMEKLEWTLEELFQNTDIFHLSGITPALSASWRELTVTLLKAAKKAGCKISFGRELPRKIYGHRRSGKINPSYFTLCRLLFGRQLGCPAFSRHPPYTGESDKEETIYYYQKMQEAYPNISVFYSTKRTVHSASVNELTGTLWADGAYYESQCHLIDPIIDRVGGGDAFCWWYSSRPFNEGFVSKGG